MGTAALVRSRIRSRGPHRRRVCLHPGTLRRSRALRDDRAATSPVGRL